MPEINNALAAQIQVPQVDIGKTLLTAGQIRGMQTKSALEEATTAQTQQNTDYNKFLQDQGAGYRPGEANTLAETAQKHAELAGRVGNIIANDPTPAGVKLAIAESKKNGVKIDPLTEQHLLSAPKDQLIQYGKNLQGYGQSSTSNIEQNPNAIDKRDAARANAAERGKNAGTLGVATPTAMPVSEALKPRADNEPIRTNPDGTIAGNTATYGQPGALSSAAAEVGAKSTVAKDALEKSQKDYGAAQALLGRVPAIAHDIDTLGPAWMGAGAETKTHFAKGWNGLVDTVAGITGTQPNQKMMFDPTKIATSEAFYKEQIRAGMELINSSFGGGKEAASIVQMGKAAVAGQGNTYLGAKFVLSTIEAAARRQADLHEFKLESGTPLATAEIKFNKLHPPQTYAFNALAQNLPPAAIETLKKQPGTAKQFDEAFHTPGLGQYILKGTAQ